jgi:hypothetical protein
MKLIAFDTTLRLSFKATFWFKPDVLGICSSILTSKGANCSIVMRCPCFPLTSSGLAAQYDSMSFSRNVDCSLAAMSETYSIGPRKIGSTSWGAFSIFFGRGGMHQLRQYGARRLQSDVRSVRQTQRYTHSVQVQNPCSMVQSPVFIVKVQQHPPHDPRGLVGP